MEQPLELRRLLVAAARLAAQPAVAGTPACPVPGQQPVLRVELFFGRAVPGRPPVSEADWRGFLADSLTPAFPDGLTVYRASGQWRDPATGGVAGEDTFVVMVATPEADDLAGRIEAVARRYRERFDQRSVGVVTTSGCAAF